jgi:hypothetical protein
MELRVRLLSATGSTPIMAHPRAFVAGSDIVGFVRPQNCRMDGEVTVAPRAASATAHTPKTVHPQRTRRSPPATTHTQECIAGILLVSAAATSTEPSIPTPLISRAVSHESIYRVMLYGCRGTCLTAACSTAPVATVRSSGRVLNCGVVQVMPRNTLAPLGVVDSGCSALFYRHHGRAC